MKMNISVKRILSFLMVAIMVIGMCPLTTFAATDVTLTFTNAASQDGFTRYLIYFEGLADQADKYWNNNTVYIDGKEVSGEGVHYTHLDGKMTLLLSYNVIESGVTSAGNIGTHTLQIKSGTALAGGEYTISNDVWLKLDGYSVSEYSQITLSYDRNGVQDFATRYVIYLDGITDYSDIYWNNNTVYVDGKAVSDGVNYAVDGTQLMMLLQYDSVEAGATTASAIGSHILEIPAGTILGGSYVVANDLKMQINGVAVTADKFVTLGYNGGGWQGTRYLLWLSDDIVGDKSWFGDIDAVVNGQSVKVETYYSGTEYALLLNEKCGITEMGEHYVTIPAGTSFGDYKVSQDLTIYTHADGSIDTNAPKVTTLAYEGGAWQADLGRYMLWLIDDISGDRANVNSISAIVNGESKNVDVALINNRYALLVNANCGITEMGEYSIQIPAGTFLGEYKVTNDLTIYTHDDGSIDTNAPKVTTLASAGGAWQADLGRYLLWLIDDISGDRANVNSISAIVNGESKNVDVALINNQYALLVNANCGITEMGEYSIQIPAGTFLGDYKVINDLTIYTHADGSVDTIAPKFVTLSYESGGWQADLGRYMLWLIDDMSDGRENINNVSAIVDGKSKNVDVALINDRYALLLNKNCGITEMGEHYVTIAAGTAFGDYLVAEDLTIYAHADGSIDLREPTIDVPTEKTVNVIANSENGQVVMDRSVVWNKDGIALAEQELKAAVADGQVLLGYVYGADLYASLANIDAEGLDELEITLDTLGFAVTSPAEIRHGKDLADSGLRFVANLYDASYSKALVVADSVEKLTVENADYKVGNAISNGFKQIASLDGSVSYSLALTNIAAADYNKTYYAAGAILVTYADGTQNYVYTDAVASTVNEAAKSSHIASDSKTAYADGVIHLDAKANLIGAYSYTAEVANNENGDYVITYTGAQKVEALTIVGQRFTAADGVVFGNGVITVPVSLFANAMLQEEMAGTNNKLQIGAYRGPSIGQHSYTDSDGNVTDYSITRTHDAVYADLEDFFAAGFNIWMAEEWVYGATNYSDNDALSALDLAAEYCINHGLTGEDIQVLITDSLLNGLLEGYTMPTNAGSTVAEYAEIISDRVNTLKNYNPKVNGVEVGTEYNCFAGYILRDEPHYDHLDYYNGWFSFLAADTDQSINVIANSASTGGQVSGTVNALGMLSDGYTLYFSMISNGAAKKYITSGSTSENACTTEEFTAYLRKFVDGVNSTVWNYSNMILTTDSYGLNTDVSSKFGSTTVTSTEMMNEYWQENLALVARLVEEKNPNATFATVLRSFGMTRLYMMAKASTWYNSVSWSEYQKFDAAWGQQAMDLQAYTSLAHGYTYLSYFTYWETQHQSYKGETFTDACVMWDDNMNPVKQNMYYWVKNTNAEIRAMENLIGTFSYNGTAAVASGSSYYCGTDGLWTVSQLAGNTAIASVSATADTTVGHYTKDGGNFSEMFILVNMSHPKDGSSDTVTVTFDSGYTSAIVYINGEATLYQLSSGVCTITIPSGEGIVILPVA